MAARVVLGMALVGLSAGLQMGDSVDLVGLEAEAAKAAVPGKDDSFIVFSSPKTGTTSLEDSLGLMLPQPCHVLNEDGVHSKRAVKCHNYACAHDFLNRRPEGSTTWMFSSVRSPFDQRMSLFFQGIFHLYTPDQLSKEPISGLLEKFHANPDLRATNFFHDRWEPLGINVTARQFDFEKGYLRFKTEWQGRNLNIMILRLDHSAKWEKMIQEVLPTFKLVHSNDGDEKAYADTYHAFKSAIRWTDEEIAELSQDETFQHFYKKAEVDALVAKVRGGGRFASEDSIPEDFKLDMEKVKDGPPC